MSDLETPEPKHRGVDILRDPRLNKMTCFSEEEREAQFSVESMMDMPRSSTRLIRS